MLIHQALTLYVANPEEAQAELDKIAFEYAQKALRNITCYDSWDWSVHLGFLKCAVHESQYDEVMDLQFQYITKIVDIGIIAIKKVKN